MLFELTTEKDSMMSEYCSLCSSVVERSLMWAPLLQIAHVIDSIARTGTWRLLGNRRLSWAAVLTDVIITRAAIAGYRAANSGSHLLRPLSFPSSPLFHGDKALER